MMERIRRVLRGSHLGGSGDRDALLLMLTVAGGVVGLVLGITFDDLLGEIIVLLAVIIAVSRLPMRWMLWVLAVGWLTLLAVQARYSFTTLVGSAAWLDLARGFSLFVFVTGLLALMRSRQRVIEELQATQAKLTSEMRRTAQLAAANERARIARDLHDILAHSLTVISVQVQAARLAVTTTPAEVPEKLDMIAQLVRESIGESRRVVSLLRDREVMAGEEGSLHVQLRELAEQFAERTGVRCTVEEHGQAQLLNPQEEETLRFAAQEAITNAFRHGQAQHVRLDLTWEPGVVSLDIHDDGSGVALVALGNAGGHGLRGMRERAEALGGSATALPDPDGGFAVSLTLPTVGASS